MTNLEIEKAYVGNTQVEKIYLGADVIYPTGPTPGPDYSQMYFTIEALSAGTIEFIKQGSGSSVVLDYSMDDGASWTTFTSSTAGTQIQVAAGDKVMFRGENSAFTSGNTTNGFSSGSTAVFDVYGNTMSLLYGDAFQDKTTIGENAFNNLFRWCRTLVSASNLILPALTVPDSAYGGLGGSGMFRGCTSLTGAPELPATVVGRYGYAFMFDGCTSLTAAPELPATTLSDECYGHMFYGCRSLTIAPELPATTLAPFCYRGMFKDCSSLTTPPSVLPATVLEQQVYEQMFVGCTSLTYGPVVAGTSPVTEMLNPCMYMFEGCTALTAVTFLYPYDLSTMAWKAYFGDWQGTETTFPASGIFRKAPGANWGQPGEQIWEGVPAGWTIVDYNG